MNKKKGLMFQWPRCLSKKWPKCISEKKTGRVGANAGDKSTEFHSVY